MEDQEDGRIDDCLFLVQQMFAENQINEVQRDTLKEMVFDEDTILLSFFDRYQLPDEIEELKKDVISYIGGMGIGGKVEAEETPVET